MIDILPIDDCNPPPPPTIMLAAPTNLGQPIIKMPACRHWHTNTPFRRESKMEKGSPST